MILQLRQERSAFALVLMLAFALLLAPLPRLAALAAGVEAGPPVFERFDRDGDGYVDRREAARSGWLAAAFAQVDADGDARLDKVEFARLPR